MDIEKINVCFHIHEITLRMFHSPDFECPELDEAEAKLEQIYSELFRRVMKNEVDCFYLFSNGDEQNGQQRIFHRSIKEPGKMQISYIWYKDGDILPTMDAQIATAAELIKKEAPDNVVIHVWKN